MRANRLLNNIGFYFLGTFSTKILQFLFIPLYTIYISTADFGYFNLTLSIITLAVPLLYQSIWEGILRFAIEREGDKRRVLATTNIYCLGITFIYIILFVILSLTIEIQYGIAILLMGISHMGVSYWQFSARALKKNKAYAMSTVLNSLVTIALNLFLIIILKWGLLALFVANIAGNLAMILFLELNIKIVLGNKRFKLDKPLLKSIIKYSLPLAINAASWWLITSSNSLIISTQISVDANGIYSMANRFGSIMTLVTSVVNLAWLEEAFRTYNDDDKDDYFNNVLDILTRVVLSGVAILIPITYIFYQFFVFGDYKVGVNLTPIIYLSAAYSTLASHLGSGFLARKKSHLIFRTTLVGGLVAVIGGFVLAKPFGLIGVASVSLIGFIIMYIIRIPMLKRMMDLKVNYIITFGISAFCILIMFISELNAESLLYQIAILIIVLIIILLINRKLIFVLYKQISKKFRKSI